MWRGERSEFTHLRGAGPCGRDPGGAEGDMASLSASLRFEGPAFAAAAEQVSSGGLALSSTAAGWRRAWWVHPRLLPSYGRLRADLAAN